MQLERYAAETKLPFHYRPRHGTLRVNGVVLMYSLLKRGLTLAMHTGLAFSPPFSVHSMSLPCLSTNFGVHVSLQLPIMGQRIVAHEYSGLLADILSSTQIHLSCAAAYD
jgi:hypothetical protein